MGHRTWAWSGVLEERKIFSKPDDEEFGNFIPLAREVFLQNVRFDFDRLQAAEQAAFGKKSCFYCNKKGMSRVQDDDSISGRIYT